MKAELPPGFTLKTHIHSGAYMEHYYAIVYGPNKFLKIIDSRDGDEWHTRTTARKEATKRFLEDQGL